MSIKLFKEIVDNSLLEYSDKSSYEAYKSIVLDPEDNEFKVIEGMFRDKKDAYERLKKRGYIVRKTFEKKVFDWIEDNSKNNIEAYLMFSTAFSKWRGNNILSDYYVKLLNDIPKLNREKIKGNPDTIGKESVLTEYYQSPVVDMYMAQPHDITVYPKDENGKRDPKYAGGIKLEKIYTYPTDKVNKKLDDPNFYRTMWKLMNYENLNYPFFDIQIDNDEIIPVNARQLRLSYETKNKNPLYTWGPRQYTANSYGALQKHLLWLQNKVKDAEKDTVFDIDGSIQQEIDNLKQQIETVKDSLGNLDRAEKEKLSPADLAQIKALKKQSADMRAVKNREKYGLSSFEDVLNKTTEIQKQINDIKANANKRTGYTVKDIDNVIKDLQIQLKNIGLSSVDTEYSKRKAIEANIQRLTKLRNNMKKAHLPKKSSEDVAQIQSNAERMAKDWAYNKATGTKGYRAKFSNGNIKEESTVPQVNTYDPTQYVNSNADGVSANIPTDGVITNPGAIQTTGTFMEAWLHGKLNQLLFDDKKLKPDVREALLKIAKVFEDTLNMPVKPIDIYFTGSSANYNYNEQSDLDLHLVYDFEQVGINAEILTNYMIAKKQVFNSNYDIKIKGIPVEVGVENVSSPIVSTAIYSVMTNDWIKQPVEGEHKTPMPDMHEYHEITQEIEQAIESNDSKIIGELWDKLYDIRKTGLASEGELGQSNALFKKLRNLGYLDRLKNAYYTAASDELSLESLLDEKGEMKPISAIHNNKTTNEIGLDLLSVATGGLLNPAVIQTLGLDNILAKTADKTLNKITSNKH